jgi:hypothetical protein
MIMITVTIILHREGPLALPALSSMRDMVFRARSEGLTVEARAVLDRADDITRHMITTRGDWLDGVDDVSFGDLGLSRNFGVSVAHGQYLAFLDGDDLWGDEWLKSAYRAVTAKGAPVDAIWHPELLYYFVESDYSKHSTNSTPHSAAGSFHMRHAPNDGSSFDRDVLFLNNIWTANVFTARTVHQRYPYSSIDRSKGLGIEDWSWNIETVWAGLPHRIVPDTVHLIRVKETGSLGQQNNAEGLLPYFPKDCHPRLGDVRLTSSL